MQLLLTLYARPVPRTMSFVAKASQFLARIACRKRSAEQAIESPYAGRAWTDTAERELTEDIATCRINRY